MNRNLKTAPAAVPEPGPKTVCTGKSKITLSDPETVEKKRQVEKKTVCTMIDIRYRGSEEGQQLKEYACSRIDRCPFMAEKTFCSQCKVHCYAPRQREQIREVMKYSGPRMLFRKPGMVIRHALAGRNPGKLLYLFIGFLGLGLGALGALLPLLPAFPFLLMAAWGFGRSSEKLTIWFKSTRLYKDNLEDWIRERGMTRKAKIRVMGIITLTMVFGFVMMGRVPWAQAILLLVWIGHVVYFIRGIRTLDVTAKAE